MFFIGYLCPLKIFAEIDPERALSCPVGLATRLSGLMLPWVSPFSASGQFQALTVCMVATLRKPSFIPQNCTHPIPIRIHILLVLGILQVFLKDFKVILLFLYPIFGFGSLVIPKRQIHKWRIIIAIQWLCCSYYNTLHNFGLHSISELSLVLHMVVTNTETHSMYFLEVFFSPFQVG